MEQAAGIPEEVICIVSPAYLLAIEAERPPLKVDHREVRITRLIGVPASTGHPAHRGTRVHQKRRRQDVSVVTTRVTDASDDLERYLAPRRPVPAARRYP